MGAVGGPTCVPSVMPKPVEGQLVVPPESLRVAGPSQSPPPGDVEGL